MPAIPIGRLAMYRENGESWPAARLRRTANDMLHQQLYDAMIVAQAPAEHLLCFDSLCKQLQGKLCTPQLSRHLQTYSNMIYQ
jgi:hypothetical protein